MVVPALAEDHDASVAVQFRHIVCAVDFSPGSAAALRFALSLAQESDAELLVLHVLEIPPELLAHSAHDPIDVDAVRAAAEAERLRRLRELIPSEARKFCTVETAVIEGSADHAILLACDARHADVVVMGVNRHGTLDRLVFGSTAAPPWGKPPAAGISSHLPQGVNAQSRAFLAVRRLLILETS
jgi:nucleotide-binding universal stress UspA family protein